MGYRGREGHVDLMAEREVNAGSQESMDTTQEKSKDGVKHGWESEVQGMQKKNMIPEIKKIIKME